MKTDAQIQQQVRQSRAVLREGGDVEAVLRHLRQAGCSKAEAIRVIKALREVPLGEAKRVVHFSNAWQDRRAADERFHDALAQENVRAEEDV